MCERLESKTNPNLLLMNYDAAARVVTDLFVVPKHLFVRDIIEPRKPLAPTARRAGWVGCNIRLDQVPEAGKVWFVRDGAARPREAVLEDWREMLFLRRASLEARSWLVEVLRCVEAIGRPAFTLAEVYAFEPRLAALYPGNRNVRPKIRQQLQALRDAGVLRFEGGGRYRLRGG